MYSNVDVLWSCFYLSIYLSIFRPTKQLEKELASLIQLSLILNIDSKRQPNTDTILE